MRPSENSGSPPGTRVRRLSEFGRIIAGATKRVLQQQLNEMERMGLVSKDVFAEAPPGVKYTITDRGRSLIPIIRMLDAGGLDHAHLFDVHGRLKDSEDG